MSPQVGMGVVRCASWTGNHAKEKTMAEKLMLRGNGLVPKTGETVGGAYVIQQELDERVVTFAY